MNESALPHISPPLLVYLGMGIFMARILLEKTDLRNLNGLARAQFLVQAASIILLWPLMLFMEKMETWLKSHTEEAPIPPVPQPHNANVGGMLVPAPGIQQHMAVFE